MSHGGDDNATDAFAAADVFLAGANATLSPPQYYSYSYRVIATLFCSIIFFVGVVGNVMVVLVVWRSKTMHTPTNCYLMSLAIADCMVLISAVPSVITGFFLVKDAWVFGSVACSIFVFLNYLGINASSLSITAFTVERYIGICHPMKAQIMCTMERANKIIVGVWIFAMAYNSPWLPLTQMVTNEYAVVGTVSSCGFKLDRDMYTWVYMADFILFYVVPLLLSCVMYGLIGRMLFYNAMPQEACMQRTSNGEAGGPPRSATHAARVQVIKMLAVVVLLFAALWMPYRFIVVYNSFVNEKLRYLDDWYFLFCKTMVYINSAINPILYNAMSAKFRRAFRKLLRCGKREEDYKSYQSTVNYDMSRTVSTGV